MNLLWGQNPTSAFCRLPHEQNPLLALNYENLCDADYLSRLFATQLGEQLDLQGQPAQPNDNESWLLTADTAEDVIVFGDDFTLGKHLLGKRFLTGVSSSLSNLDILSTSVQRQVVVFEIIGRLIRESALHQQIESRRFQLAAYERRVRQHSDSISSELKKESKKHLASEALGCALKTLARHSRDKVNRSSIDPILFLLLRMYQDAGDNCKIVTGEAAETVPEVDKSNLQYLREILCNGVEQGIELFLACRHSCSVKENEENLKLSMSSAYGLLSIGVYARSPGDILMAFLQLISISLLLDECQSFIPCIKDHNFSLDTPCRKPQELSEKAVTIENDELLKTQIKAKVKLKSKDNGTTLFPIITKSPGSVSFTSLNSSRDTKHLDSQNDLHLHQQQQQQQQQRMKNKKLMKWEVGHSRAIILEKVKEQPVQSIAKLKINSLKSRIWNEEELNSKQVGVVSVGVKVLSKRNENGQNADNNGRNSNNCDNESQSQSSQLSSLQSSLQSFSGSRPESKPERKGRIMQSLVAGEDSAEKDKQEALRVSMKCLSYVPKSVLRVLHDGCAEYQINSKTHATLASSKSSHQRSIVASRSCVWSCGQNSYGELGHGDGIVRKSFTKVAFFEGRGVVSIGAGNEHSVFVCVDGRMYVTGYNDNGQCGSGKTEQVKAPQQVTALEGEDVSQAFVFNGCEHTLVTTKDGKLFAFGYNYRGQVTYSSIHSTVHTYIRLDVHPSVQFVKFCTLLSILTD
jgi:Regulator of chromosome condensation (RCC1) repeat